VVIEASQVSGNEGVVRDLHLALILVHRPVRHIVLGYGLLGGLFEATSVNFIPGEGGETILELGIDIRRFIFIFPTSLRIL
jgi:hypothetical protein